MGALILAMQDEKPVGCEGIRLLEKDIAELKRIYVKPGARGKKIGMRLLGLSIKIAGELGYRAVRLDTLPFMADAIRLYQT